MADETIYAIDEMVARPGMGRAVIEAYMARYAPGARARGMVLDRVLVSPPLWLEDQSNTITISWTLRGAAAWWQMTAMGRTDPSIAAWWAEADEMLVSRRRSFAAADADVEALCDV